MFGIAKGESMNCPICNKEMEGELIKEPNWIEYTCECGYHVGSQGLTPA